MSYWPLWISEYSVYLFIGIALLISIIIIAVYSAEECTLPAECFDCRETTCLECCRVNQEGATDQWVQKPNLDHSPMLTSSNAAGPENNYC